MGSKEVLSALSRHLLAYANTIKDFSGDRKELTEPLEQGSELVTATRAAASDPESARAAAELLLTGQSSLFALAHVALKKDSNAFTVRIKLLDLAMHTAVATLVDASGSGTTGASGGGSTDKLTRDVVIGAWGAFKAERETGSGSAAASALELLLLLLPQWAGRWEGLPVAGATLVSELMVAYTYGSKIKASAGARGAVLELLGQLLTSFPDQLLDPPPEGQAGAGEGAGDVARPSKDKLGGFTARWLLKEGAGVLRNSQAKKEHDLKAGALAAVSASLSLLPEGEGNAELKVAFGNVRASMDAAVSAHLVRYSGLLTGLRLLASSAPGSSLGALMAEEMVSLRPPLQHLATHHKNRGVRDGAADAWGTLFRAAAYHLERRAQNAGGSDGGSDGGGGRGGEGTANAASGGSDSGSGGGEGGEDGSRSSSTSCSSSTTTTTTTTTTNNNNNRRRRRRREVVGGLEAQPREARLCLAALGHLAPCCSALLGPRAVRRTLRALSPMCASVCEFQARAAALPSPYGGGGGAGSPLTAGELLDCVAAFVAALPSPGPADVALVAEVAGAVAQSYSQQWPAQRVRADAVLSGCLLRLSPHPAALQALAQSLSGALLTSMLQPSGDDAEGEGMASMPSVVLAESDPEFLEQLGSCLLESDPATGATLVAAYMPAWVGLLTGGTGGGLGSGGGTKKKKGRKGARLSVQGAGGVQAPGGDGDALLRVQACMLRELLRALLDACRHLDLGLVLPTLPSATGDAASGGGGAGGAPGGSVASATAILAVMNAGGGGGGGGGQQQAQPGAGAQAAPSSAEAEGAAGESASLLALSRSRGDCAAFGRLCCLAWAVCPALPGHLLAGCLPWALPQLARELGARAPLLPPTYRLMSALLRGADRAGLLSLAWAPPALGARDALPLGHAASGGRDGGGALIQAAGGSGGGGSGGYSEDAGDSSEGEGAAAAAAAAAVEQRTACVAGLRVFLKGALLSCERYKGDLLQVCLELLLAVPPGCGLLTGRQAATPLAMGLRLGVSSHAPGLALAVVEALERWEAEAPGDLAPMLPAIAPLLAPYLADISSSGVGGDGGSSADAGGAVDASGGGGSGGGEAGRTDDGAGGGGNREEDGEEGTPHTQAEDRATQAGGGAPLGVSDSPTGDRATQAGGDSGTVKEEDLNLAGEERAAREAAATASAARRRSLAALQPRLQLWLGRGGAAAAAAVLSPPIPGGGGVMGDGGGSGGAAVQGICVWLGVLFPVGGVAGLGGGGGAAAGTVAATGSGQTY
ncbi:hypothetical protein FOA52_012573 [Chlamydomonas sp. UWO 241]|nr:hypothetical protein FOA52_012573 [Chlamydomonas sp. UWO 241]